MPKTPGINQFSQDNAALANGLLANPNGLIHHRHERTIIIAAANTWGPGGRNHNSMDEGSSDAAYKSRCTSTAAVLAVAELAKSSDAT